jgi:hypothetical protein
MIRLPRVVITLALMTVLTACDPKGGGDAAPSPAPSRMSDQTLLVLAEKLAHCWRTHGIPDLPDPIVRDGHIWVPKAVQDQIEANHSPAQIEAAQKACRSIVAGLPFGTLQ